MEQVVAFSQDVASGDCAAGGSVVSSDTQPLPAGTLLPPQDAFRNLQDSIDALSQAMARMERSQKDHANDMTCNLQSLENKVDARWHEMYEQQASMNCDIEVTYDFCLSLERENKKLWETVGRLEEKIDSLENHSRRNNLLFFGIPKADRESWDDCERLVREVIEQGLEITQHVAIKRAHRAGQAIIVKLLSYKQKQLILSRSSKLRGSSVVVREDFSQAVRNKRQGLVGLV
nr:hypothetical protein BaRGS_023113 [Batillaria attramentaria]